MYRLTLLTSLLLSACAGETAHGPSLAKRAIESRGMEEPLREAAAPAPPSAALGAQIDGLIKRAQAGQREFAALLPRARTAASQAGAQATESWIVAQQLLSALEKARAPSTGSLAELDALMATRLKEGDEAGLVELQAAGAEVSALVEAQQRDLDGVRDAIIR
jgi:hypothetical protein